MSTHTRQLSAKVTARNVCHALLNEWAPKLQAALFAQFTGKKVLNQGYSVRDKVREALLALVPAELQGDSQHTRKVGLRSTSYSPLVQIEITTGEGWEHAAGVNGYTYKREGWERSEATFTLGECDKAGVLLANGAQTAWNNARADFTEAEVVAARKRLEEAKDALHEAQAQTAIAYFGERDR